MTDDFKIIKVDRFDSKAIRHAFDDIVKQVFKNRVSKDFNKRYIFILSLKIFLNIENCTIKKQKFTGYKVFSLILGCWTWMYQISRHPTFDFYLRRYFFSVCLWLRLLRSLPRVKVGACNLLGLLLHINWNFAALPVS